MRNLMETGRLSSKGQITIPKKIREFLHIQTSERLVFLPLEDGKVLITTERKSASSIFGMLKHKKKEQPVSLEQMDTVIQKKRLGRLVK
jgi:antitoxin PrlF